MGRGVPGDMVPDSCSLFGFWLVPENVCVFLPNKSAAVRGVAKYMKFSCSPCISRLFTMSEHDVRENVLNICNDLTGFGSFAGIITKACVKVCENILSCTDVFWTQGDLFFEKPTSKVDLSEHGSLFWSCSTCFMISWITYLLWLKLWESWEFFCCGRCVEWLATTPTMYLRDFLSVPENENPGWVYFHSFAKCAESFSLKLNLKLNIYW